KEIGTNNIKTAGRLIEVRKMGKLTFARISDSTGSIQISFNEAVLGEEEYNRFLKFIDRGDIIGIEGDIYKTKKGELTISVQKMELLGKCLNDLPEKWHGLQDLEAKWRQRYLDLIMNPETMEIFKKRTKIINYIRSYLSQNSFEEVETPILQPMLSGANAKPFTTHHNALDMELVLRIAPETYLKRLIVGGYERVFELGKDFRNEDIDPQHLQEFTMLEYYAAYWNYKDNMKFTQNLIKNVVKEINGSLEVEYNGIKLNFEGDWPVETYRDVVLRDSGIDLNNFTTIESLDQEIKRRGIVLDYEPGMGLGKLIDKLYKKVSRPKLIQPMFLINHPTELVPLARKNDDNPRILDMFQVVINGWEIVKGYSELVDPLEQRRRFEEQAKLKSQGDEEALDIDNDYLEAMEYGMPPVSGTGIGIDRLTALLTNSSNLRDVILFPILRSKKNPAEKNQN
ncbi:MAG: lysine--tRNA ligase, partial [Candidatus Micrarchaeia archaeon]